MTAEKTSLKNILFSFDHATSPFTYYQKKEQKLSTSKSFKYYQGKKEHFEKKSFLEGHGVLKAVITIAAFALTLPTLGLSLVAFYGITGIRKWQQQSRRENGTNIKISNVFWKTLKLRTFTPLPENFKTTPPPLNKVPEAGCKIGIHNIGNTCWLNSALKFLATDDFYDSMLTVSDGDIEQIVRDDEETKYWNKLNFYASEELKTFMEEIHQAELKGLVSLEKKLAERVEQCKTFTEEIHQAELEPLVSLEREMAERVEQRKRFTEEVRQAALKGPVFSEKELAEIVEQRKEIRNYLRFIIHKLRGQDENNQLQTKYVDTLAQLLENWNRNLGYKEQCDPADIMNLCLLFSTEKVNPEIFNSQIQITNKDEGTSRADTVLLVNPVLDDEDTIDINAGILENLFWEANLTNAPEKLTMNILRNYEPGKKIRNPIKTNSEGYVSLDVYDKDNPGKKETVNYEIIGAIHHSGGSGGGHYTFIEKTVDGYFLHNDSRVSDKLKSDRANELIGKSVIFKLKKVVTVPSLDVAGSRSDNRDFDPSSDIEIPDEISSDPKNKEMRIQRRNTL